MLHTQGSFLPLLKAAASGMELCSSLTAHTISSGNMSANLCIQRLQHWTRCCYLKRLSPFLFFWNVRELAPSAGRVSLFFAKGRESGIHRPTRTCSICSNTTEVAIVAGASSMIFWCLRCTEQSRPKREMALPYWSARICTSRWRDCLASLITKMGEPGTSAWTYNRNNIMQTNSSSYSDTKSGSFFSCLSVRGC